MLMLPKTFTNETLDAVTCYRGLYVFARNGQAEPSNCLSAILPQYHKIFISGATGRCKYTFEFLTLGQTLGAAETPVGN